MWRLEVAMECMHTTFMHTKCRMISATSVAVIGTGEHSGPGASRDLEALRALTQEQRRRSHQPRPHALLPEVLLPHAAPRHQRNRASEAHDCGAKYRAPPRKEISQAKPAHLEPSEVPPPYP